VHVLVLVLALSPHSAGQGSSTPLARPGAVPTPASAAILIIVFTPWGQELQLRVAGVIGTQLAPVVQDGIPASPPPEAPRPAAP